MRERRGRESRFADFDRCTRFGLDGIGSRLPVTGSAHVGLGVDAEPDTGLCPRSCATSHSQTNQRTYEVRCPPSAISESVTRCARSETRLRSDLGRALCSGSAPKRLRSPQNRQVLFGLPQKAHGTRLALSKALGRAPLLRRWAPNASWLTRLPDCRFPTARQFGAASAFIAISRIVARVLVVRRSAMGCQGPGLGPRGARRAAGGPTIAPIYERYCLQTRNTVLSPAGK